MDHSSFSNETGSYSYAHQYRPERGPRAFPLQRTLRSKQRWLSSRVNGQGSVKPSTGRSTSEPVLGGKLESPSGAASGDQAEGWVRDRVYGIVQYHVVQHVESFYPERQSLPLQNAELLV